MNFAHYCSIPIPLALWVLLQAVFKMTKSLGLSGMMNDWVFESIVRCLSALPLLPNYLLYEGLLAVGNWARACGFMHWPLVRDLFAYIDTEWMRRYRYLSVCGSEDRTNNISGTVKYSYCSTEVLTNV